MTAAPPSASRVDRHDETPAMDAPSQRMCWVVSDGRIGIENQALGLAEAVAHRTPLQIVRRRVARPSLRLWGRTRDDNADEHLPAPDVWIGCGRAAVAHVKRDRRRFPSARFIYVQDPRRAYDQFDVIIAPAHDRLERPNALSLLGAPNRITPERLAEAKAALPPAMAGRLDGLPRPRAAVLIGGDSKRHRATPAAMTHLLDTLQAAAGGGLMVTTSRRTPEPVITRLRAIAAHDPRVVLWTGETDGPNPYLAFLAQADVVVATEDSTNMITDAATAGRPVLLAPMAGRPGKLQRLYDALRERDLARPFTGTLEPWPVAPLRETERAAAAVAALLDG